MSVSTSLPSDEYIKPTITEVEKGNAHSPSPDEGAHLDPVISARVTRKFDKHIIPWLFGLWLLAFIDRSNIGNAKIDGLAEGLNILKGNKFNIALAIFYVPYIIVDIPSNWLVKRIGAGYYLPGLVFGWGIVSMCLGFVKTYEGLLAGRFFLGLMEGGLLGGVIIYLAMFYERKQIMIRIGLFYCAAPLSGAFGGLLATGLSQIRTPGYDGWPFIFFIEGVITILFGLLAGFFLPHTPSHSKFLTQEEKEFAVRRMHIDAQGAVSSSSVDTEKFSWHWVKIAILNWNTALLSLNFFAIITPIYSFSLFLPTIISTLGYKSVKANLLTVPPNMAAFFAVLLVTYFSDRIKQRGIFMLGGATVGIIGYIMLIASPKPLVQYGGTFFVAVGIFPCSPMVMGWMANNVAPHYVRATATGFQICIANCAAFIATFTYVTSDAPRYKTGHAINLGMLALCLVVTAVTILYCKWENAKREKGERDDRLDEDQTLLGHRHPKFRYAI
ncbi:hypothetical protein ONS95_008391 [Cadophora gregata]|uniref:uncharacterized protein n=1 Tax=Cadophora gregata TaxID=51156 RepID=UPI0026DD1A77|nr:uncharacterized protein ONS95_008391 [Cadophora gregata]KAK0126811.1 hypothetical protein ONS95_008391 [Cadophora gregata]